MSTSNQQTLTDSGANERPLMLDKGNYIPWESRFRRFLVNKLEDGEQTLMFGYEVTSHVRHSRLMDEFDKFAAKEGESLESVHKRLTTLVNIMDRNNVHPIPVFIYVLYDSLIHLEPHVLASKAKKAAKNHDPLALIAHSNASSSQSHANSSYSPQPYYVTHPSSVVDYEDEYQVELQGDSQEYKLTTMARIQPTDGKAETVLSYDAKAVSEVNASSKLHEQLTKKAFKDRENRYLEDIVDLEEKLSSHDRIVYKMENELLKAELEKNSSDSKDIQANLLKRIKILENNFKRSQAQSINFELKLQHHKEKMAFDVSWKSQLSTKNNKNVLLKTQVDFVVKEREEIKLEYQNLFNSIKATQPQHQKELDELIEHVNQKTYAYANVRAQNQDLLMTISELKNKLKTVDKGKNVNTKFDKSET
ncbi:hypothetical protein Tco_1484368 [Tanacetum coccineum]